MTGVRFLFRVTLRRHDLAAEVWHIKEPQKPEVLDLLRQSQSFDQEPRTQTRAKKRWFRHGQKWRTGCEGRVSVTKRRHGLSRCRYKGPTGMGRWVSLGVIGDTLINIGRVLQEAAES
jgi:hypothetical protein